MLRRPARLLLTGLSVLVAAFVVTGTVVAYDITSRTTLETFSATPGGVDLVVSSKGAGLTPRQVRAVRTTPGVAAVAGRIDSTLTLGTAASGAELTVSADPGSGPLSAITTTSGTYPSRAGQIALHRLAATRLGAGPGSTLLLRTGETGAPPIRVTVTGLVDGGPGGPDQAYAPDTVVAALIGTSDVQRLDIAVSPGTDTAGLMTKLDSQVRQGPAYGVVSTGDQTRLAEAEQAVRGFDDLFALIAMFVAVAVVAAGLVTTSTFRIVFAQRLRQLALLRAIGARRGQLVSALAIEGAVVGLLTGTVGVLLATAAGLAVPRVAAAFGRTLLAPEPPLAAGVAVVIGAGLLTAVAVLAPAFAAAGVAPLQALRSASTSASERGIGAPRVVVGGVVAIAAAVLAWRTVGAIRADEASGGILLSLVGVGALTFGALIVFGPVLVRPILAASGWVLRGIGPVGRLAVGGVGGAPRRAAAVAVVVALGVTLVSGTLVGVDSLRVTAEQKQGAETPADLMMALADGSNVPDAVARLRADPHFQHITPFALGSVDSAGGSYSAIALDLAALPTLARLRTTDGTLTTPGPGQSVLSRQAAEKLHARVGSVVSLGVGQERTLDVRVTAILADAGPLNQELVLAPADLARANDVTSGVLADAADGSLDASLAVFRPIAQQVDGQVSVLADARSENDKIMATVLLAALGLLGLTVLISVIGVGTTTGLSVLERTRETGLLRALGLNRRALQAMIGVEAGLYGVIGSVVGIGLSIPFAWLALQALRIKVSFTVPVGWLLLLVTTMIAITMAAGLLPARKAGRVSPVAALAAD
jgi:putative ABC transport system permease protein